MKRTLKFMLVAILAMAMLTSFAFAQDAPAEDVADVNVITAHGEEDNLADFSDAPEKDSWKYSGLNCAAENGIMVGHGGLIRPDDSLTRAELVTMMVRVLGAENLKVDVSKYVDVSASKWYYENIQSGVATEIINGSGNKMMPEAAITREQTFAILARTFLLINDSDYSISSFNDASAVSAWAKDATNALVEANVVRGDASSTLRPKANVTRAEFAAMLDRIVCIFAKADVDYSGKTIEGSIVINDAGVDLSGAVINGDVYIVEAVGEEKIDLSNVTVNGRIVVRSGDVTVADGDEDKIVTPEDMPKEETPVVVPPADDKEPGRETPNVSSTPSRPRPEGPSATVGENTYITYSYNGGEAQKLYADVADNTVTFDFAALADDIEEANGGSLIYDELVFHKLYVESDKRALCKHDLISFYSNEENDLAEMLVAVAGATNNVLVPIEGEDGTTYADLLTKMIEADLANALLPELFEELNIEVRSENEAVFDGFIGSADFSFCIKVAQGA